MVLLGRGYLEDLENLEHPAFLEHLMGLGFLEDLGNLEHLVYPAWTMSTQKVAQGCSR